MERVARQFQIVFMHFEGDADSFFFLLKSGKLTCRMSSSWSLCGFLCVQPKQTSLVELHCLYSMSGQQPLAGELFLCVYVFVECVLKIAKISLVSTFLHDKGGSKPRPRMTQGQRFVCDHMSITTERTFAT